MNKIDELQAKRNVWLGRLSAGGYWDKEGRQELIRELKRLTGEMLEELRDGVSSDDDISEKEPDDKGMLWSQQDKLRLRVISLEAQVDNQERCIEGLRAWANDVDSAIEDELTQRVASIEHLRQLDREEQDRFRDAIWKRIAELHKAVKRLEDKPTPPHLSFSELQKHAKEFEEDIGRHFKVLAEQFGDLRQELDERIGKTENEVVNQGARITLLRDEMKALERNKVNAWADKTLEVQRRIKQLRAWADDTDSAVSQLYRKMDGDDSPDASSGEDIGELQFDVGYEELEKEVHSFLHAYGVDDCDHIDAGDLDGMVGAILGTFFYSRVASRELLVSYEDFCQRTAPDGGRSPQPAPCPYCGSGKWQIVISDCYCIRCRDCGARGPTADGRTMAYVKWNKAAGTRSASSSISSQLAAELNDAARDAYDVIAGATPYSGVAEVQANLSRAIGAMGAAITQIEGPDLDRQTENDRHETQQSTEGNKTSE